MKESNLVVEYNRCLHSNSDIKKLLRNFDFKKLNNKNYINHLVLKKNKGPIKKHMVFIINNKYVKRWTDMIKWNQPKLSGPWSINVQDINLYRKMPGHEDISEDDLLIKKTAKFTFRKNHYTLIAYSTIGDDVEKLCCKKYGDIEGQICEEIMLARENKEEPVFRTHYRNFLLPRQRGIFKERRINSVKKYDEFLREKEDEEFYLKKFKFHEEVPHRKLKLFDTDEEEENVFMY